MAASSDLRRFLASLVDSGQVSGLSAAIADGERRIWSASFGLATAHPRRAATRATRWDLASLTKPAVATLALSLDAQELLPLGIRVGDVFGAAAPAMRGVRLESLLRHRSGLRAWTPLRTVCARRSEALDLLLSGELRTEPPGRCVYSDLGYMLWGWCAEQRLETSLSDLLSTHVFEPLGMRGVSPAPGPAPGVAECLLDDSRERQLAARQGRSLRRLSRPRRGEPQDGNARFLGDLAGHAGLFGTVDDLVRLGREWLRPGRLLDSRQVRHALAGGGEYGLGWARRRIRGTAGAALGKDAFGQAGSTGTSLWIDPSTGRIHVLLAHRANWRDLRAVRREFHHLSAGLSR